MRCEIDNVSSRTRSKIRCNYNAKVIKAAGQAFAAYGCNVEEALVGDLEVLSLNTEENLEASMNRDPLSYHQAMSSIDSELWRLATLEEWGAILSNGTFQAFEKQSMTSGQDDSISDHQLGHLPINVPAGTKVISSKWVYKKKINPDGTTRYKVWLVIRGFEQVEGTDFGETYAPVSKLTTFRMLISIAARHGWAIDHMDVTTAFLNPKIDCDEVYMSLPPGMDWIDPKLFNRGVRIVRLRKALYGLRQAPKLWFDEINGFLLSIGFKPSAADPNLYIKGPVILLLYVDDMIIVDCSFVRYPTSGNRPEVSLKDITALSPGAQVKKLLTARYKMTDLGKTRRFLGIEVIRDDNNIILAQNRYIDAVLRRFRMEDAHEVKSLMDANVQLDNTKCEDRKADTALYQSIVGSLIQYNKDPLQMHLTTAKRVLRHLKYTRNYCIHHSKASQGSTFGFIDSDWAGRAATRKSVGGCIFFWSSRI